jgi:hypothetical protein
MDYNRTLNIFLSVILTFFAGIVAMCITIFKCHDNPNGKRTLLKDESIICGEDKWNTMLAVAIASCAVYIVGFGGMCCYIILVAPGRFHQLAFQRRWKFLLIKYRPDVWWWTVCFCLKGFLMNIGFIFLDSGVSQIMWVISVSGVYAGWAMFWNPWRHRQANFIEIYGHMILLAVLAILIWYAHDAVDNPSQIDNDLSILLIVVNATMIAVCLITVISLFLSKPHTMDVTDKIRGAFKSLAVMSNKDLHEWLCMLSEWDRFYLVEATALIRVEQLLQSERWRVTEKASKVRSGTEKLDDHIREEKERENSGTLMESYHPPDPVKQVAAASEMLHVALEDPTERYFDAPVDSHVNPRNTPRIWQRGVSTPRVDVWSNPNTPRTPRGEMTPRGGMTPRGDMTPRGGSPRNDIYSDYQYAVV